MLKAISSRVIWVGRATVFLVGLAVILAVVLGVATTALAGTGVGDTFNLGKVNTVDKISSLIGSVSSAMLKIDNNGTGPALTLQVEPGKQPMTVNSDKRVARLNADTVDGQHASEFWSGLSYTRRQDVVFAPNETEVPILRCDSGDIAVGGGYSGLGPDSVMSEDGPFSSAEGSWIFTIFHGGATSDTVTLKVRCADISPFHDPFQDP